MKRKHGVLMLMILPTADVLNEPASTRRMLDQVDVSLEAVAEAILLQWAQIEGQWGHDYNPFDTPTHKLIQDLILHDFLHSTRFHRLSLEDQRLLVKALRAFTHSFFTEIIPLLEELNLTSYQLQTMRVVRWLGRSMVVDILL